MCNKDNLVFKLQTVRMGYGNKPILTVDKLAVYEQDLIFLKGANGSGKSTFVKTLCQLLPLLNGELCSYVKKNEIGYLPQKESVNLAFPMTVEKLVALNGGGIFSISKDKVDVVLKRVNLFDKRKQLLRECSGGELQRALFASIFIRPRKVLILDEPESNMDKESRLVINHLITRFVKKGGTVLWISHYLTEVDYEKKRIFNFEGGKIYEL